MKVFVVIGGMNRYVEKAFANQDKAINFIKENLVDMEQVNDFHQDMLELLNEDMSFMSDFHKVIRIEAKIGDLEGMSNNDRVEFFLDQNPQRIELIEMEVE